MGTDRKDVTIIITTRHELLLKWTVDNIKRTCSPAEIIVVHDGLQQIDTFEGVLHVKTPWTTPQGVGKCRDWGFKLSKSKYIVWLDAHMDFEDKWLDVMIDTVDNNPRSIVCSKSAYINEHGMKSTQKILSGAYIRYIGGATGIPLEVEWGDTCEPGVIQCCLGACYCMESKRYKEIGMPYENAFGWGTSEQTLCMVNELCGGVNILAECVTGHIYRDNKSIPYSFGIDHKIGRTFNRLRLISMIPMEEQEYIRLMNITMSYKPLRVYSERAMKMIMCTDDLNICDRFTLSWEEYCNRWWPKTDDKKRNKPVEEIRKPKPSTDERFI